MIPRRWTIGGLVLFATVATISGWVYLPNLVWPYSPSWSSALMNLGSWFMLLPSALAGWAAWQGWRQKRLGPRRVPPARSSMAIMADWYRPALVASVLVPLVALVWMAPQLLGRPRLEDLVLVPVACAALLIWTVLGAIIGRLLPLPIAAALAIVVAFLGTAFPQAQPSFTYRHVLAQHGSCCLIDVEVSPRVLIGSALFHGVTLLVLVWVLLRVSWPRVGVALLASLLTFQLAAGIVRPVDSPDGVRPRPASALVCVTGEPTVCLWPEQESERSVLYQAAHQIRMALARHGIGTPGVMSADPTQDWDYVLGLSATSDNHRRKIMIDGLVSVPMPICAKSQPWPMSFAFDDLSAWVWITAGFDRRAVAISPELATVLQRPADRQAAWFMANMAQRSRCRVKPVP